MASYGKSTNCSGVAKQRNGAPESLLNLTISDLSQIIRLNVRSANALDGGDSLF